MSQFNHSKPTKSTIYYPSYSASASRSTSYQPSKQARSLVDEYFKTHYTQGSLPSNTTVSTADYNSPSMDGSIGSFSNLEQPESYHNYSQYMMPSSIPSIQSLCTYSAGLSNLGNTCYMNSILQCVFNTKKLANYFERGYHLAEGGSSAFVKRFHDLLIKVFTEGITREEIVEGLQLFKTVVDDCSDQFVGHSQQDAHEFFRFLIEKIHSDLNRAPKKNTGYSEFRPRRKSLPLSQLAAEWKNYSLERDNSIIREIFGGIQLSELVCLYCQQASYTFEDTLDFPLTLPPSTYHHKNDPISIYSCLNDYTKDEVIEGYSCGNCKYKTKAKRRMLIWKQPEILVIQLKRFTIDLYGHKVANKRPVSFPLYGLDLGAFTHGKSRGKDEGSLESNFLERVGKYNLYAIACHTGDLDCGHCTAIVWNEELNSWLFYDDAKITQISEEKINQIAHHCQEPYILFYKRV